MSELFFKSLDPGRLPRNGGSGAYPPVGKWTEPAKVIWCRSGYHLFRARAFWRWVGPELYLAEGRGESIDQGGRLCFEQVRLVKHLDGWDPTNQRLAACDFAERALRRDGAKDDRRSWEAIRVARRFARGRATQAELDAAWSAARDAALTAAWSAALTAAGCAASAAASYSASAAASYAAWSVAWSANAAARDAEERWQIKHVLETYLGLRAEWEAE